MMDLLHLLLAGGIAPLLPGAIHVSHGTAPEMKIAKTFLWRLHGWLLTIDTSALYAEGRKSGGFLC